jgi:hypothetical protein
MLSSDWELVGLNVAKEPGTSGDSNVVRTLTGQSARLQTESFQRVITSKSHLHVVYTSAAHVITANVQRFQSFVDRLKFGQ